jgi:hypothetical protein
VAGERGDVVVGDADVVKPNLNKKFQKEEFKIF